MKPTRSSYDVVIVGGGHNGLVAAAYLARAGRSVAVLERQPRTGGAAVSARLFPGVDVRVSRYSYLVSLLPRRIVDDLGLRFATKRRRISSYTPVGSGGLLVDTASAAGTRASFRALTGSDRDFDAWRRFYGMTHEVARQVFPTLTEPLPTRAQLAGRVGDPDAWAALFERPLGETIEATFVDDTVRGVVLTDALIGTFTDAHDPALRQNRCFLYHVIGGGTGDWDVPVGGMGALTDALADAARAAGAELVTDCAVDAIETGGAAAEVRFDGGAVGAGHVLVNAAPHELDRLLGRTPEPKPEGAQLKINMVLRRLPRLRDTAVDPRDAFAGTFHIAESYSQLAQAYREAAAGRIPAAPPSEIYCHTLTDPSILSAEAAAGGMHTLTLFGLHTPARLFADDPAGTTDALVKSTIAQLDSVLAEPIADCLATDANGNPCLEAKSPIDLEREIGLPGGHIFHRDLAFPYRTDEADDPASRWGVATGLPNVFLCGAGAVRGGGVSGIPGHNAAMAVLE
ncbi:phytoene desaturase family protein [Nocardia arthritidis]|uniref:FAD-dependent oxidoreductase n=1 Tax=Nocardia arthritidis TaxID=228602 RepID=A0A6G9YF06_9NOCA|nr:NAD(P)/FAD-dependent oxidoreductase [Nocardia arthritidis]QIS11782.1 FAD-dependent oxidoreductase [Nocardia arthritidis]